MPSNPFDLACDLYFGKYVQQGKSHFYNDEVIGQLNFQRERLLYGKHSPTVMRCEYFGCNCAVNVESWICGWGWCNECWNTDLAKYEKEKEESPNDC